MDADIFTYLIMLCSWFIGITVVYVLWPKTSSKVLRIVRGSYGWINEPLEGHPNKRERLATTAKIKEDERARKAHLKRIDKFIKTLHSNS